MTLPALYADGQVLRVGRRIGLGGEGAVHIIDGLDGVAVKLYVLSDLSEREAKVETIISRQLARISPLIAYPTTAVRTRDGSFAGFLMKHLTGHKPLHELYSPGARKIHFPAANYRFLVRVAANIARAVAQVHKAGCVIGDINSSGILISDKAIAALIDADSFQISDGKTNHLCYVGVPEYTPPELQGRKLGGLIRSANHDAFGLAVIIFQLLFMGRHPFIGAYAKGEMPIERAIGEHRFAYTQTRAVGMTPPPGASQLDDLPPDIARAFETAFSGTITTARPTAETWVGLIQNLENSLVNCRSNQLHHFASSAKACPWCRMESQLGMILFLPTVLNVDSKTPPLDPSIPGFDLASVWAAIESVRIPQISDLSPLLLNPHVLPSQMATIAKRQKRNSEMLAVMAIAASVVLTVLIPTLWFLFVPAGVAIAVTSGRKGANFSIFEDRYRRASSEWHATVEGWHKRLGIGELSAKKAALILAKRAYEGLPGELRNRLTKYQSDRRALQLHAFLDTFQIRSSSIRGIGPAKQTALASYGIETAADVERSRVLNVPGFGPVNSGALLEWRKKIEARFVYSDRPNSADKIETDKIHREIHSKAAALRGELVSGRSALLKWSQQLEQMLKRVDPAIARAHGEKLQAETDLRHLGRALPYVPTSSPAAPPSIAKPQTPSVVSGAQSTGRPTCPACGSVMVKRLAQRGTNAGTMFWGCIRYPSCRGTRSRP